MRVDRRIGGLALSPGGSTSTVSGKTILKPSNWCGSLCSIAGRVSCLCRGHSVTDMINMPVYFSTIVLLNVEAEGRGLSSV